MANGLTPEQEEFLRQQLNWFEKLGQLMSFVDEYLRLIISNQNNLLASLPNIQALTDAINALVDLLSGGAALENPPKIASEELLCPVAGQAEKMPDYEVPRDKELVIKALSTNWGTVRVGNTKMEAENPRLGYPLLANEAVGLKIKNAGQLWICANMANEGIHWIVEQE
jgi:hypothetical protein